MYDEHDQALIKKARESRWEDVDFADEAHSEDAADEIRYIAHRKYRYEDARDEARDY